MTVIIVDSTCDIPQQFIDQYGIEILPLHVVAEGKEYTDGITISTHEVYDLMRKGVFPKTSQVSINNTFQHLTRLASQGKDLLYLAFSSKMSGTYERVKTIMEDIKKRFPQRCMAALDSKGGSFATGLIAIEAAKEAFASLPFEALIDRCRFLIEHVEHVFVVNDLVWMIRGGRVSKTLGYTANLLNIKPILDVDDGEMEVIQKVHGRKKSLERVAQIVAERARKCTCQLIGITHADDIQAALTMRDLLQKRLPNCSFMIEEIGAVLGVHLGIGGVGVFFFNQM